MPNSRCFLIGHRDTSSDILPSLTTEIEHHIREQGITEFVVGQYGGFDRLAAHALYRCKTEYPGLTLTLLCAYHPAERAVILPRGFDGVLVPGRIGTGTQAVRHPAGQPAGCGTVGVSDRRAAPPRQLYRFPGALCPGTAAPGQAHRYPAPSAGWKPLPSSPLTPAPLLPCVSLATLPGVCYNNPHVHHPSQGGFP